MQNLTTEQAISALKNGVRAYYFDLICTDYPYSSLINTLTGVDGDLAELKTVLSTWKDEEDKLLVLIESADVDSILASYSKEADDSDMIAKFEASIAFTSETQKYAFLSAINAII